MNNLCKLIDDGCINSIDLDNIKHLLATSSLIDLNEALRVAASAGSVKWVQMLLPWCSEFNGDGVSSLGHAAAGGHVECIEQLLLRLDPTVWNNLPLRQAILHGQTKSVEILAPLSNFKLFHNLQDWEWAARHRGGACLEPVFDVLHQSERTEELAHCLAVSLEHKHTYTLKHLFPSDEAVACIVNTFFSDTHPIAVAWATEEMAQRQHMQISSQVGMAGCANGGRKI